MFRIYPKKLTEEEIEALQELWADMELVFKAKYCKRFCENGSNENCELKRLCNAIHSTQIYVTKLTEGRG